MHEIVTLQLGEAANYLGTHFWNAQESYFTYNAEQESPVNHDIHFRPGVGADGTDTFTPRTLIYDFKKNFGTLRRLNELYELDDDPREHALSNPNAPIIQSQPRIPLHPYQQALNEGRDPPNIRSQDVRFWSDFNRVYYNPKSIVQIHEDNLGPQQTSFGHWAHGEELFSSLQREKDLLDDDLRPLIEECDQMQGIQLLTSVDDGWGGFASSYIETLRDEYPRTSLWVWAAQGTLPQSRAAQRSAMSNEARCLAKIAPQTNVYIPLARSPPRIPEYLHVAPGTLWNDTALQCVAMESLTLPSRLKASSAPGTCMLDDISMALGRSEDQPVAELGFRAQATGPATGMVNGVAADEQHRVPAPCVLFPFSAESRVDTHVYGNVEVLRGSHLDELVPVAEETRIDKRLESRVTFPLLDSFPALLSATEATRPSQASIATSLKKTSAISRWTQGLMRGSRIHFTVDEREILSEELSRISAAYETQNYSEEDWDD